MSIRAIYAKKWRRPALTPEIERARRQWILIRLSDSQQLLKRDKSQSRKWADENSLKQSYGWKQGGLATAFDLAAFRLSMIARVKKSVNHSRTVASMRGTGWEQQQEFGLRSDSRVWSEFAFGAVGHCFLCYNQFFFRSNVELTFSFLLVLRLSLHAVCYAKNEISEHWS